MTVYTYSKVAVYAELGGAVRLAQNARSFVTDAVTGLPVDVTQGARVAPYLDTDANGIADFTAENPGPLRLTTGTVFVDVYSNELPGIALDAVAAAEAAQVAAEAAVAAATGPTDATVAGLIAAASATQTAGDARWAVSTATAASIGLGSVDNTADLDKPVSTATAADIAALEASSVSVEDLIVSALLIPTGSSVTASMSLPILAAPYPMEITSLSLTVWGGATVPLSETAYWTVELRILDSVGAPRPLADKTTKTTAGTYPAGEAITNRRPWSFSTAVWAAAVCLPGETLHLAFLPTGAPPAIGGASIVTVGYRRAP